MIKHIINKIVSIPLIDSAVETAKEVKRVLGENNMICEGNGDGLKEFYVTDSPGKFAATGEKFFGHAIKNITMVNLEV